MHSTIDHQALSQQRLKQIQKSNKHVNNLIQSAKKMIYNQQQLSSNQKEVLQVKISIEKDHLKNVFCKIDCPDDQFRVEIKRKGGDKKSFTPDGNQYLEYQQNYQREEQINNHVQAQSNENTITLRNYDTYMKKSKQPHEDDKHEQHPLNNHSKSPSRQPNAKITISRYVRQSPQNIDTQQNTHKRQVKVFKNQQSGQYQIDLSDDNIHQTVFIKPDKISKVVVNTRTEPVEDLNQKPMVKSYFVNKQRKNSSQQYTPSFSNYRKQKQEQINEQLSSKSSDIHEQYASQFYQDQISIKTPNNQLQVISTQTEERLFAKPNAKNHMSQKKKSPKTQLINFNQNQPSTNNVSTYDHYKQREKLKESQPPTSYKDILHKNKERLQNSREKLAPYIQTPKTAKSTNYELHLDKLYKKKSEQKKRLYGTTLESSPKLLQNTTKSSTKKYSIANSHKVDKTSSKHTDSTKRHNTSRKSLSITKSPSFQLSSTRKSPLHSNTLKSYNSPCSKCVKCSHTFTSPKQSKQTFEQFYLAKKYLTPEGEQQCYNFLRSQGIPEKDWGSYITEYVYRQLSRVYQEEKDRQRHLGEEGLQM